MTNEQTILIAILVTTIALFIYGRWRYDLVALAALMAAVATGLVPTAHAFSGFSHPAVITVAAVLVLSRSLQNSSVVDLLAHYLSRLRHSTTLQISANNGLVALFSGFMNNVGALALMLPVVLRNKSPQTPPSMLLMPLSFASLLGGLVTLIGTPPNIIIATYRDEVTGTPFAMFDFAAVGLPVALVGLAFLALFSWRLLPRETHTGSVQADKFQIRNYMSQATLPDDSPLVGKQVRDIETLCANEVTVIAIIRGRRRLLAPDGHEQLLGSDILIVEGDALSLTPLFESSGLVKVGVDEAELARIESSDVRIVEAVVMPGASIIGSSMRGIRMHERYGINLLAVAREDRAPMLRLGSVRFKVGDVLILQGDRNTLRRELDGLGCVPLAGRGLTIRSREPDWWPLLAFAGAITVSALGIAPIQVSFVAAIVVLFLFGGGATRDVYRSIEWPVIVLLAALIPVGEALSTSGTTDLIAMTLLLLGDSLPVAAILAILMVVAMLLSDLVHNSPTAILMAPVSVTVAEQLALPADAFLMAVAIGAASPYLTPIGHQCNTLVMGPGGYRFSDYWRVGLPLDVLIVSVAVPLIMLVWLP